jgi:hypothetical protein
VGVEFNNTVFSRLFAESVNEFPGRIPVEVPGYAEDHAIVFLFGCIHLEIHRHLHTPFTWFMAPSIETAPMTVFPKSNEHATPPQTSDCFFISQY